MLLFLINLVIGCYMQNLGPISDVLQGGENGYWKLTRYKLKGKSMPLSQIPGKFLLETKRVTMMTDSAKTPFYPKGSVYNIFSFCDHLVKETAKVQGIYYDYDENKKTQQTALWYRINEDSGFLVVIDASIKTGIKTKITLSGVLSSPTYKPELDSIRYIYEPTSKFR